MTEGPPPSEATSSKASNLQSGAPLGYTPWYTTSYAQYNTQPTATAGSSVVPAPALYQPYPQTGNPYAAHYGPHSYYPQYQSHISQPPTTSHSSSSSTSKQTRKPPPPSPSPSPPLPDPETYQHWDAVIRAFFLKTGLTQALKGLEADMLVLNSEWEQVKIPLALQEMIQGLTAIMERRTPPTAAENEQGQMKDAMQVDVPSSQPTPTPTAKSTPLESTSETSTESLENRKLAYVHLADGVQPRSQSSINKSISIFLAQNQAKNDASNRAEFLSSLAERRKRQRNDETEGGDVTSLDSSEATGSDIGGQKAGTCARADAKPIDRDAQMKYDIAKDDWGPLSRSAKAGLPLDKGNKRSSPLEAGATETKSNINMGTTTTVIKKEVDEDVASARHPGLDERLKNIEDHIAVRFVPNPPRTLLARLKFLEDHLIKLEKEYPPWAALHFNQPGRGWPPPPRTTPIIVPLHLRDTTSASDSTPTESTTTPAVSGSGLGLLPKSKVISSKPKIKNSKPKSSLHRAVMERLEVQRAMSDVP